MTETYNYRIWMDRYLGISSGAGAFKFMLLALIGLSIVDAAVSYVGIVWLGSTEGNPLFYAVGSLLPGSVASLADVATVFMIAKVVGGGILVGAAWNSIREPTPTALHLLLFVSIVYIMVTMSNLIGLIGGI